MKRLFLKLAIVAASAFALAACTTAPAKPEPAPQPVTKKTLAEMEYELRMKEIDAQTAREERSQKALIKFAAESDNDFAKGVVAGLLGARQGGAPAEAPRRSLMDSQAQADAIELKKLEIADRNSGWNRFFQVYDRAERLVLFSQGLKFRKFEINTANSQERYRLDTVRGAQADGFAAGSGATLGGVSAGASTTLGGITAGANAAAIGARAVLPPPATEPAAEPSTETPAE
jgi:hypothetical protein